MKSRYCELCPCKINTDTPSPMALERLHAMQADAADSKKNTTTYGCDWAINSSEYNYCFWELAKNIDAPIPDKEICQLLGITQPQLREIYNSAIKKLKANKDSHDVKEFIETVIDSKIERDSKDDTSFLVDTARAKMDSVPMYQEQPVVEKGKPGRKPKHMPTHRDGKKKDIYFAKKKK